MENPSENSELTLKIGKQRNHGDALRDISSDQPFILFISQF